MEEGQGKLNYWPSPYWIALAKVIFRAIMTVLGCWFLVPRHNRCEFLCWSLSRLHLIKVRFSDLHPVTFPSVVHTVGIWCQPLNMCLGGNRSAPGHYFDSLPHLFLTSSRCAWGSGNKELTRKCSWVETLQNFLVTYETRFEVFANLEYKIFEFWENIID